jgi:hypothetical protein
MTESKMTAVRVRLGQEDDGDDWADDTEEEEDEESDIEDTAECNDCKTSPCKQPGPRRRMQTIVFFSWSATALVITLLALIRDPASTARKFSYWVLSANALFFLYVAIAYESVAGVVYRHIDYHHNEWRWQNQPSYSCTSLFWSTLNLLSLFIFGMLALLLHINITNGAADSEHLEMTFADLALEVVVHILPIVVLVCVIGMPVFRLPFLHTTCLAALFFGTYNLMLVLTGATFFDIYHIATDTRGNASATISSGVLSFTVASALTECTASDLLQSGWKPLRRRRSRI